MTSTPPMTASFSEGRYFDLWMIVHFVSGAAGGYSNVYWELPGPWVYLLALFLMLLWEAGEYVSKIHESWSNRIIDIVVGMVGVALAERSATVLLPSHEVIAFVVTLAIALAGMGMGVRAFKRRQRARSAA